MTLDDDSELKCAVVAIFLVQNKDYIALLPLNEGIAVVYLYRFKHNSGEDPELENIEDDAEFEAAANAYDALVAEEQ